MQPQRPTAVLVMAILNFAIGAIWLFSMICGGLSLVFLGFLKKMPASSPGAMNPFAEIGAMFDNAPGYVPYTIITSVLGGIMAVVLIVAGIGLLKMRQWARSVCVVYSVYGVLSTLVNFGYTLAVVNPAMVRWQEDLFRRQGGAAPVGAEISYGLGAFTGLIWGLAYPIALVVVLYRPRVSAAFAGRISPPSGSGLPPDSELPLSVQEAFRAADPTNGS